MPPLGSGELVVESGSTSNNIVGIVHTQENTLMSL